MTGRPVEVPVALPMVPTGGQGLWADAFRRLVKSRGATSGGVIFGLFVFMALAAPLLTPYDPIRLNVVESLEPPSARHWLGTDQFGRDVLARVIYGARVSMAMGVVAVTISVVLGLALGLVSGYYRGTVDLLVMRLVDVMLAFPGILLALVIIAVLGPNLGSAMIAVGVSGMPLFVRVVRSSTLTVRALQYVEAAQAAGSSDARVLRASRPAKRPHPRHRPRPRWASRPPSWRAPLSASWAWASSPRRPTGARCSAEGRAFMGTAWWLSTFPGLAIAAIVLAINRFGDGLRDALDPRLKL